MIDFAEPTPTSTPLTEFVARVHEITDIGRDNFSRGPGGAALLDIAIAVVDSSAAGLGPNDVDVLFDLLVGNLRRAFPHSTRMKFPTREAAVAQAAFVAALGIYLAAMIAGEDMAEVARELRWVGTAS